MDRRDTLGRLALGTLYVFGAVSVAGFGTFGLNPGLLARFGETAARIYAHSFSLFAQGQVALAGLVLAVLLVRATGFAWLPAFGAAYGISLASELAGTTWGIPFGEYGYTELLGVMWLDRVPALIPLSWFTMALPAYALARLRWPEGRRGAVLLGSLILLAWDVSLDPAMSHATPYWWWGSEGAFYGMPVVNLIGWYLTGLAIMLAFAGLRVERWVHRVPAPVHAAYYGANLLVPLGMCVAAGLWGAVAATGILLGGIALHLRSTSLAPAPVPVRA